MTHDLDALLTPPTEIAARALEVCRTWSSEALINHCLRSWVWAVTLGESERLTFDGELLFVATMLHDLGVSPEFDAVEVPFEVAGGAVGQVFAAGAGWPREFQVRVGEIIERHMWVSVDPSQDAEGYLLETATSLDVAGAGAERWDAALLRSVVSRLPRLDFASSFAASIHAQAERKPDSNAARLVAADRVGSGEKFWAPLA